ncbi:MAG: AMIN domain-containing protein [Pseudomonadota bacterium]
MVFYLISKVNITLPILLTCLAVFTLGPNDTTIASESLLKEIQFKKISANEEKVIFLLNGFYPPEIFALKGEKPRVVCDFINLRLENTVKRQIDTNGDFIQCIRVGIHPSASSKVRVVLDLVPYQSYDIQQIFFRKDNTFVLIVHLTQAETEKTRVPPAR